MRNIYKIKNVGLRSMRLLYFYFFVIGVYKYECDFIGKVQTKK